MSKTPYEIRLELLKMAKEMLEQDYFAKREALQNEWNVKVGIAERFNTDVPPFPTLPDVPTEQEVIIKASALNEFISKQ